MYLFGHNASNFDAHIILQFVKEYNFKKIIKANSKILDLTIQCKNVNIHIRCTFVFLTGSLS